MAVEIRTDRVGPRPLELAAAARWPARVPMGDGRSLRIREKPGFRVTGRRMTSCLSPGAGRAHLDAALGRAGLEALQ